MSGTQVTDLVRRLHESGTINIDKPMSEVIAAVEDRGAPEGLGWNVIFGDNYALVYPFKGAGTMTAMRDLPRPE